jgi:hypothetical protein
MTGRAFLTGFFFLLVFILCLRIWEEIFRVGRRKLLSNLQYISMLAHAEAAVPRNEMKNEVRQAAL